MENYFHFHPERTEPNLIWRSESKDLIQMLKHRYKETKEIRKLLNEIEAYKIVFKTITPLPNIEENIRRESLLKSSLFSARIEGNPLTLERADRKSVV